MGDLKSNRMGQRQHRSLFVTALAGRTARIRKKVTWVVIPLRSDADREKVLEATAVTVAITRRALGHSSGDSTNPTNEEDLSMIQADLDTLKTLYQTLKDDVQRSDDIQKLTDTALQNAVWESANAKTFRDAWTEFKPQLIKFEQAFATAATDVANNYNNNVDANGENLEHLAPVEAIA